MADESIISYSDLIGKDSTFEDIKKELSAIESQLLNLAKNTKAQFRVVNPNDTEQVKKLQE